ncbi:hypothetical protein KVR01_004978 [Diaporthe batatas]|uniref:uncharacterized protein n=1 Tax=Diaporthe batatas TaxID=748121 RepID=UPI001D044D98|nr:uncharacterized protein KVR01_004978 [Diaporthe batatas]KAG8164703.1 hypothetical protein KVR01_004978 [Diaporthe batatas]
MAETASRTMSSPSNITSLSLEDQVSARLTQNHFPYGWKQKYMPSRRLDELVTRPAIIREFLKDDDSDERDASQARIDEDLITFIVTSGKKLFAISLAINIGSSPLHRTMKVFWKSNYTDQHLPVTLGDTKFPQSRLKWGPSKMENFTDMQWRYLVPMIEQNGSHIRIGNREILPFCLVDEQRREGTFSNVWQVRIHEEQQTEPMQMFDGSGKLATAAIKELKLPADSSHQTSEAEALWEREASALKAVNRLRHEHIIEMKAMITWKGKGTYFMFQWADGGSLRDFYAKIPQPPQDATFVKQILLQLTGLSSALNALHNYRPHDLNNASYRHGDLKPENILRFKDGTKVGLLKIADLGLAKLHLSETSKRGPTVTRHGTPLYEPPEVILEPEIARSRQYDIWSMGCVLLELLVWLMYGYDELVRFNESMTSALGNSSVYWVMEDTDPPSRSASVHPSVVGCMDIMGKDLQHTGETALGDLLSLVKYRLLVVRLPRTTRSSSSGRNSSSQPAPSDCRAKAADLENAMQRILNRAERDKTYASTNLFHII